MDYLTELAAKYLDLKVVGDFEKILLLIATIVVCMLGLLGILYILKYICFMIYTRCSNEDIQEAVTSIIYKLDEFADHMDNKQKKQEAINDVKSLFVWRSIPIPACVIGWIIDCEVHAIRSLQAKFNDEKVVDLHHEDENNKDENKPFNPYTCPCPECKKKYQKFFKRNYESSSVNEEAKN